MHPELLQVPFHYQLPLQDILRWQIDSRPASEAFTLVRGPSFREEAVSPSVKAESCRKGLTHQGPENDDAKLRRQISPIHIFRVKHSLASSQA